uniref:Uncharacterized protein n=1 Tax=Romanomermis culicivorax TaxID=13658 RepID=A0A915JVH9_ROMCU
MNFASEAAFMLYGTATAAVNNQTVPGKTDVKYDWLHGSRTEIRLVTAVMTEAVSVKYQCAFR